MNPYYHQQNQYGMQGQPFYVPTPLLNVPMPMLQQNWPGSATQLVLDNSRPIPTARQAINYIPPLRSTPRPTPRPTPRQIPTPRPIPTTPGNKVIATASSWPPELTLPNYQGPYPRAELEQARCTLFELVKTHNRTIVERLLPKLGITNRYGEAERCPPPPVANWNPVIGDGGWPTAQSLGYVEANQRTSTPKATSTQTRPSELAAESECSKGAPSNTSVDSGYVGDSLFDSPYHAQLETSSTSPSNPAPINALFKASSTEQSSNLKRSASALDVTSSKKMRISPSTNQRIYKCDLCVTKTKDRVLMEEHLINAKHYSASLYNTSDASLVSVEEMLAVVNTQGRNKALVVACPDCKEVFENIFQCSVHHKHLHGSTNGCYALCPITNHETMAFGTSPICAKCGLFFSSFKELHTHWKTEDHSPVKEPRSPDLTVLHLCPYCPMIFYNNLLMAKNHALTHKKCALTFAVEVKHILIPKTKQHEMLPFRTDDGCRNGISLEIKVLKSLEDYYQNTLSGSKQSAKNIKKIIQNLQKLI